MSSADRPLPGQALTAAQTDVWLAQQIAPGSPIYTIAWYVELAGDVDVDCLADAVRRGVEAAECLHVRFDFDDDGEPTQVPVPAPDGVPQIVDLTGEADPEAAAREWVRTDLGTVPDLETGPLFGQALLLLGPGRCRWYQRYHHAVIDGAGVVALTGEVARLYTDPASAPAAPDRSLSGLVRSDRDYRDSAGYAADRAYWLAEVAGHPEPRRLLSTASTRTVAAEHRGVELDPDAVRAAADAAGVRRSRVPIAAVAAYVSRALGVDDVVLALPTAARTVPELRGVPGMVSTVLPLRLRVDPASTFVDLLRTVDAELARHRDHLRFRGEDLARAAAPDGAAPRRLTGR